MADNTENRSNKNPCTDARVFVVDDIRFKVVLEDIIKSVHFGTPRDLGVVWVSEKGHDTHEALISSNLLDETFFVGVPYHLSKDGKAFKNQRVIKWEDIAKKEVEFYTLKSDKKEL